MTAITVRGPNGEWLAITHYLIVKTDGERCFINADDLDTYLAEGQVASVRPLTRAEFLEEFAAQFHREGSNR